MKASGDPQGSTHKVKQPFAMRIQRKNPFISRICYSSLRNLFVDSKGDVYPCCFNRVSPWGNLISDSLSEIENSILRKQLEVRLSQNLWDNDCSYCRQSLTARNYKATGSLAYDRFFFQRDSFPCSIEFELDTFCNLNCVMCPENLHSNQSQTGFDNRFAEKISPWLQKIHWAKFYGGEPFLISGYYDIWNVLAEKNPTCLIKVQTNGTVLNERVKKLLERGHFQISVSVDSLDTERYAEIRCGGDLDRVLENLTYFRQYAKRTGIALDIAVCPMVQNAEDIPDLFLYCCKNGMYINFNVLTQPREMSLRFQSSAILKNLIETYKTIRTTSLSFISWQNRRHLASLISQLQSWHHEALVKESIPVRSVSQTELTSLLSEKFNPERRAEISKIIAEALREEGEPIPIREDLYTKLLKIDETELLKVISENPGAALRNVIRNFLKYGPG